MVDRPENHPWSFVLLLFFVFIAASLLGAFLSGQIAGNLIGGLSGQQELLPAPDRQALRWSQAVFHFISFTVASLVVARLAYGSQWLHKLGLSSQIDWRAAAYGLLLTIFAMPLFQYLHYLNLQVELSESARLQEEITSQLTYNILSVENTGETLLLFVVIAVLPALGEELLIRGLLQGRVLPMFFRNVHVQIWIAALIFSLLHAQLAGLLPRWLLGAVFGYAFWWSKSIWVPVLLHLLYNGLVATTVLLSGEYTPDTQLDETPSLWYALLSLLVCSYLIYTVSSRRSEQIN